MANKECKHNIKLAFNNDEIISYCDKCGKILDRYVKVKNTSSYYYGNGISITPSTSICGGNVNGSVTLTSVGDPYTPEMGSHTSASSPSDITERIYKYGKENKRVK